MCVCFTRESRLYGFDTDLIREILTGREVTPHMYALKFNGFNFL